MKYIAIWGKSCNKTGKYKYKIYDMSGTYVFEHTGFLNELEPEIKEKDILIIDYR